VEAIDEDESESEQISEDDNDEGFEYKV